MDVCELCNGEGTCPDCEVGLTQECTTCGGTGECPECGGDGTV